MVLFLVFHLNLSLSLSLVLNPVPNLSLYLVLGLVFDLFQTADTMLLLALPSSDIDF